MDLVAESARYGIRALGLGEVFRRLAAVFDEVGQRCRTDGIARVDVDGAIQRIVATLEDVSVQNAHHPLAIDLVAECVLVDYEVLGRFAHGDIRIFLASLTGLPKTIGTMCLSARGYCERTLVADALPSAPSFWRLVAA